jgi:hypothetical protein
MKIVTNFVLDKETKGTFRYAEVDDKGKRRESGDLETVIGTIYLRKTTFSDAPKTITVTVS